MASYILILAAAGVSLSVPLLWWAFSGGRGTTRAVAHNLTAGRGGPVTDLRQVQLSTTARERAVVPAVAALADRARRLTPAGMVGAIERRIDLAGRPSAWPIERVLAAKLLAAAAGLMLGLLMLSISGNGSWALYTAGLVALGYFAPDLLLYSRSQERQKQIRNELPDTLDQMTICVEAGLGFDAAMSRAAKTGQGAISEELKRTLQEVQIGLPRSQALRNLMARTDAPDLRHFVLAVLQAESYGVPIAQVLRVQAAELRVKRRQRAEERAMKIPVLVLFPLVFCIFPTLFIVLLVPAGIRIAEGLGGAS